MPGIEVESEKKVLPIIYVLDTSGSMYGERIAQVNDSMRAFLQSFSNDPGLYDDVQIKISVLTFSTDVRWMTGNKLVPPDEIEWQDLEASGVTNLGAALYELEGKLCRAELFEGDSHFMLPVIIFMSDGGPTDDWERALKKTVEYNKWFSRAKKIAIAIGDNADIRVLGTVVGDDDAVVKELDDSRVGDWLYHISKSSCTVGQQSDSNGKAILQDAANNKDADEWCY